jgi:hypothetical protein
MRMRKKRLKGNEKLRAVYASAASALTVQFDDFKTERVSTSSCPKMPPPIELGTPQTEDKKPP